MEKARAIDFLKEKVELFKDFPPEKMDELAAGSTITTFEPNEAIIEFGEEGRFLGRAARRRGRGLRRSTTAERRRLAALQGRATSSARWRS